MPLTTEQAQRRLNTLSTIIVGAMVAVGVFGFTVMCALLWLAFHVSANTNEIKANAQANTTALSALRADVRTRHDAAVEYLRDHPNGLTDKYGNVLISQQQLRKSINDQESTLAALYGLNCPVVP